MHRCLSTVLIAAVAFTVAASRTRAAEPIAPGATPAPAITAAQVQLSQYLYVDFPRCVQALANECELADAELDFLEARVDNYRPFRSFKQYSPAYTADRSWQLTLLAAKQRRQDLENVEANLWRERQAVVAAYMQSMRQ